jgi:co-chaperonin GroES (HSP10)
MKFDPLNRFLLLEEAPKKESEEPTILLPDDYNEKSNPFGVYKINQVSVDCSKLNEEDVGKLIIVNDAMVETASLDQGNFILVQENHVYGVLD